MNAVGMTELLFQVELPDWPVATFTRDVKDSRIIMNHIRFDDDHFPTRNVFTVLAAPEDYRRLLAQLQQLYSNITVLREDPQALSVLVEPSPDKMKFLKAPFTAALRALGPDRILRPIIIRDGWMTVGIVTAAKVEIGDVIRTAADSFKKGGLNMKLIRWGEYRPEDHPIGDFEEKLTAKQVEIVKMGLALGFYNNPRSCNLETLAGVFGISKAAAHNRLKSAERKILTSYFS
ncbi:MAG: helix-turn-helix domain-containing protein [Halobacteriales archaeon]|nr:helix-turn-helix domain-containing protein [Halobacteriales archaeon]